MAEIPASNHVLNDGSTITIRVGIESDLAQLLKCAEAYIQDGDGQVWEPGEFQMTEEKEREWIIGLLKHPSEILLLAEHDGTLLGNIDFHIGNRRRWAHVGEFGLSVLKEWRGRGIGSLLLKAMIAWAEQNQAIEKINLHVLSSNDHAIKLYRNFGFIEEGRKLREIKYANGTYVDDVLMAKFV